MKFSFFRLLAATCALGLVAAPAARADDLVDAKARMAQRLPELDQFKAKGELGENSRGLVELRNGSVEAGDVMAGENRDRAMIYAAIAKQTGSAPEQVGRAQGRQIATDSAPGTWLQHNDGGWYRK